MGKCICESKHVHRIPRTVSHCYGCNQSVVGIINRQASKCPKIMQLVRKLILVCLKNNILFQTQHICGIRNITRDSLSRFKMEKKFQVQPEASRIATPPASLGIGAGFNVLWPERACVLYKGSNIFFKNL